VFLGVIAGRRGASRATLRRGESAASGLGEQILVPETMTITQARARVRIDSSNVMTGLVTRTHIYECMC